MRNLAMSSNASFDAAALRWSKSDLPITIEWRSSLWRFIVPPLWALGWAFWIWVLSVETPGQSAAVYALLFISIPLLLAATAAWWVGQLLSHRHMGTLVVNDDYLEWQFEIGSSVEMLAECGPFELRGKHSYDACIEWERGGGDHATGGWTRKWIKADRSLYGRDVGLDRNDLDSLCRLLNQLRDEAKAQR
jgi:hypothetical protein